MFYKYLCSMFLNSIYILFLFVCIFVTPSSAMQKDENTKKNIPVKSLVFLDDNQEQDNLNFLSKKHPSILSESEKQLIESPLLQGLRSHLLTKYQTSETFISMMMRTFHLPIYNLELCEMSQKEIDITKGLEQKHVEEKFGFMALSAQESLIYDQLKVSTRTIIEDIIIAAHQIDHIQITKGLHPVLFLGRTPCFLQHAYRMVCDFYHPERLQKSHILHLNYSGTPDAENTRTLLLSYSETSDTKNTRINQAVNIERKRNLVTPEKLAFYCQYMDHQGMRTVENKLYLVDLIAKGTSLNSFLRILRYYYETYLQRATMPDVHFIAMNSPGITKTPGVIYTYDPIIHEIRFNSNPQSGIRPLKIKTTSLCLSYGVFQAVDYTIIQNYGCRGISFPAQKWRKESLDELERGGEFWNGAYMWFRDEGQKIIQKHDLLYRRMVDEILN